MYVGLYDSKGRLIGFYGGVMFGFEFNWIGDYIDGLMCKVQYCDFIVNVFCYIGFNLGLGLSWMLKDFDFDCDLQWLQINEVLYCVDNFDFWLFQVVGGKFFGFQGWSDILVVLMGMVDFYEMVVWMMGGYEKIKEFFCFYVVFGMWYCLLDGDGVDNVDFLIVIENWVEWGMVFDMLVGYNFDWYGVIYVVLVWLCLVDQICFMCLYFFYLDCVMWLGKGDVNDFVMWWWV